MNQFHSLRKPKNMTDFILKRKIESCIKIFCERYYTIEYWVIPHFESGDYKEAKQDIYSYAMAATSCQDLGTQLFSKELQLSTIIDMMHFIGMLSS